MNIDEKINVVENILKGKMVAIGFSGGSDSTLLSYLSSRVASDTLAITIDNHLFPKGFIEHTRKTCETFNINHKVIDIDFYENKEFLLNGPERCHTCRSRMYSAIRKTALENGYDFICDGNNLSDLVNDRPGILITYEKNFKTPFITARLTSKEIHEYLNRNNICYSKSTTCLATRIPSNTHVTRKKIQRISRCEDYITYNTNCEIVKVRDLNSIGIVEVDNINEILSKDKFKQINDELKQQGFQKIALNLSEIEDNDHIIISYDGDSFSYRLPYTINLENTKKKLSRITFENDEKICSNNITIYGDGLIEGHNLENYDTALNAFMDILPLLRRNI